MPFWDAFLPKVGCPIGVSFIFSIRKCLPFRRESTTNSDNFLGKLASEVYDKVTQFSLGKSCHFSIFGEKIRTFWKNEKSLNFVVDIRLQKRGGPIDDAAPISSWRFRWNLFSKQSWLKSFASKSDPIRNQNSNLGPSQVYDKTTRQKNRRFFVFSNFCPTFLRGLRFSFPFSKRYQQGTTLRRKWLVWKIEEAMRINLAAAYD